MKTKHTIFTVDWNQRFKQAVNQDSDYRKLAKGWKWPVIFRMYYKHQNHATKHKWTGVWVDLWKGTCREIEICGPKSEHKAVFVIAAEENDWMDILENHINPVSALLQGKLKLEKGSMVKLIGYTDSANRLLEIASQVTRGQEEETLTKEPNPKHTSNGSPSKPFKTTSSGIDFQSFPIKLFDKAKRLGIWNPADIDFSQDTKQWQTFTADEKNIILHLTALFQGGEEAVTNDIMPLISAVSEMGRLEDELYLTSFLWEEAKHTEFFQRFLLEVTGKIPELTSFHSKQYKLLFQKILPENLHSLKHNQTGEALIKASVTYNIVVEGMLAETGYYAFGQMLEEQHLLPGLREGIELLKRDESRHIAYGLYLIQTLLAENKAYWPIVDNTVGELVPVTQAIINAIFDEYEKMPFGLKKETFLNHALNLTQKRIQKIRQGLS